MSAHCWLGRLPDECPRGRDVPSRRDLRYCALRGRSARAEGGAAFPRRFSPARFARVGRTVNVVFRGMAERGDMRVERETGLVAREIERHDAAAPELLRQSRRRHALRFTEMPDGAQNQARFDAGCANARLGRAIDGGDHLFRREAARGMQQRGEADSTYSTASFANCSNRSSTASRKASPVCIRSTWRGARVRNSAKPPHFAGATNSAS